MSVGAIIHHIIQHYDSLPDVTVFLPGSSPDVHKWLTVSAVIKTACQTGRSVLRGYPVDDVLSMFQDFQIDEWQATNLQNRSLNDEKRLLPSPERPFGKWYEKNFQNVKAQTVVYHSIFALTRSDIQKHPVDRYKRLIAYLDHHSNPEAGHYMERSWAALFQ